jgi:hypothetical protein
MTSGLAITTMSACVAATPTFTARPYPMLPPVGTTRTFARCAASSTEPSSEPLSASTMSSGSTVALSSESRKAASASPGE